MPSGSFIVTQDGTYAICTTCGCRLSEFGIETIDTDVYIIFWTKNEKKVMLCRDCSRRLAE